MEDNAASNNSELVDAAGSGDADASAPASDEVAVEQEESDQPPPPMAVVEAPSPINSEAEDEAEDQAAESQPSLDVADVVQPTEENGGVREEEQQEDAEEDRDIEEGDDNGAALLQQLSESLRQQTDLSNEQHQSDSQSGRQDASDHRAVADRQLEDHKRELQQLQSELRRELAEEKRQLDERLAGRQQAAAGDSDCDKPPSRLALDNPIHMAESERMFLRNRERGVGSHCLSGDWSEEHLPEHSHLPAGVDSVPVRNDSQRSPTESLRQSLADLERRQLIDTLPQARDSMGSGGGGGGPAWDRDAQLAEIRTLEQRYDQLQLEKRRVESALNHVPGVGSAKYGRQSREDKDRLEKRLDSIDRELGSLRITLRQYHVIKSAC